MMKTSLLLLCVYSGSSVVAFAPLRHVGVRPDPAFRKRLSPTPAGLSPIRVGTPHRTTTRIPTKYQKSSSQPLRATIPSAGVVLNPSPTVIAWSSMTLLALQFGIMPTLQKKFVPPQLCRSSMVLAQEVGKFLLSSTCFYFLVPPAYRHTLLQSWSLRQWTTLAALPATLYAIQNYAKLVAYQHLPAVTYSVLNQTKTLLAALFCYLLLGIPQSGPQMIALGLLLLSALIIESVIPVTLQNFHVRQWPIGIRGLCSSWRRRNDATNTTTGTSSITNLFLRTTSRTASSEDDDATFSNENDAAATVVTQDPYHFSRGVLPLLLANLTSGLAAALGQRALQQHQRNVYLYSMELSGASALLVAVSLLVSRDGYQIRTEGWQKHWTKRTWIPIGAHALGGLLVGLVTKYAGSVQKGFALIFGVLLSGVFQKVWLSHEPVTREQVVGGFLACLSLWMHSSFPPTTS